MRAPPFRMGLDEAGLGPRLGPLVVGCVVASGDRAALRRALLRGSGSLPPAIDSKLLYQGDLRRIECLALAVLGVVRGVVPALGADLFPEGVRGLADHPWYQQAEIPLPLVASPAEVADACDRLRSRLARHQCSLDSAVAVPVLEGELNRRTQGEDNKADLELRVIEDLWFQLLPPAGSGEVLCDRLGGRKRYGDWLAAAFPFAPLDVVEEREERSAYLWRRNGDAIGFQFLVGGESQEVEIALASVLAKYSRELFMTLFNGYWGRRRSVEPTAGYWQDAGRWIDAMAGDAEFERHRGTLLRRC